MCKAGRQHKPLASRRDIALLQALQIWQPNQSTVAGALGQTVMGTDCWLTCQHDRIVHALCPGDDFLASDEDVVAAAELWVLWVWHGVEWPHLHMLEFTSDMIWICPSPCLVCPSGRQLQAEAPKYGLIM